MTSFGSQIRGAGLSRERRKSPRQRKVEEPRGETGKELVTICPDVPLLLRTVDSGGLLTGALDEFAL